MSLCRVSWVAGPAEVVVAATGTDAGTCPATSPCRTIGYALTQVGAGGTVRVGPGRYRENLSLRDGQQVGIVGAGRGRPVRYRPRPPA
jgi:hypothetical protein